jgi:hypothetical protein
MAINCLNIKAKRQLPKQLPFWGAVGYTLRIANIQKMMVLPNKNERICHLKDKQK